MEEMSIEQLIEQVKGKAWVDIGFRKALIADPKKAIEELFEVTIPEELKFNILEEKPKSINIIIPADLYETELSEDDLEKVAGGRWCFCKVSCVKIQPECFVVSGSVGK